MQQLEAFGKVYFAAKANEITALTQQLITTIEQLEQVKGHTEDGHCTVCGNPLKTMDTLIKEKSLRYITVCSNCPQDIYNLLARLEEPTGVMWI